MIKIQFQINIQVCNIPESIAIAMIDMFESKEDDDAVDGFFFSLLRELCLNVRVLRMGRDTTIQHTPMGFI